MTSRVSKAFDSIDHNLLVAKLEAYGIRGNEKEWFLNYLDEQTADSSSEWSKVDME